MQSDQAGRNVTQPWIDLFEDRYGIGAFERLLSLLRTPCTSFAEVAERYGVTRERVRQWQLMLLPDAPRGHERRRLCLLQSQKRKLMADPLFRAFYRQARAHFQPRQFGLVKARTGFRRRVVRLEGGLVVLKRARRGVTARPGAVAYALTGCARRASFIYYQLTPDDFLFVPCEAVPPSGTTFIDAQQSRYRRYRNSFEAALATVHDVFPIPEGQSRTSTVGEELV